MSFKNNAKRNGDIISPCNKPTSHEKRSDNELKHLTLSLMLLYIDLITSNIFPSIPALIILYHRLARDTELNYSKQVIRCPNFPAHTVHTCIDTYQ